MPRKLQYIPGETYGPNNLLLLKRSNKKDKRGKAKWGWYECPDCKEPFEAYNIAVKKGETCRCPQCRIKWRKKNSVFSTLNKKYEPGMRVGPNNILFIKELNHKGKYRTGYFKCPICGREDWHTRLSDVCSGASSKCYECYIQENICRCKINGKESASNLIGHTFGEFTVIKLIEQESVDKYGRLWLCKCSCGGERKVHSRDLTTGKIWHCGCLTPKSKGEDKIKRFLQKLNINFYREYLFDDCCNLKTSAKLRFDFYLPDYNCCIEYDGIQHFQETTWRHESLSKVQYRDNIKNEYCKQNNIQLIRIPYWDYDKIDEQYLNNLLLKNSPLYLIHYLDTSNFQYLDNNFNSGIEIIPDSYKRIVSI